MKSRTSLMRWGLWTLPVSGLMFITGYLINGALPNPETGAAACMSIYGASNFAVGAFINMAGMLLNPFGFFALYAFLTARGPSRAAAGGMILNVLGLAMTLVGYGIIVLDLPLLGRLYVQGKLSAEPGFAAATNPVFAGELVLSGLIYLVGSFLFSTAMWRDKALPKWVAVCFTLSALFLCFGPLLPVPALWAGLLGSVLLAVSGGGIVWRTR
jgi:hypothetical protein